MEITSKNINGFTCEKCLFTCCKKGDMSRHILTRKHKNTKNTNENYITAQQNQCVCGLTYKHVSSLYKHQQKCQFNDSNIMSNTPLKI